MGIHRLLHSVGRRKRLPHIAGSTSWGGRRFRLPTFLGRLTPPAPRGRNTPPPTIRGHPELTSEIMGLVHDVHVGSEFRACHSPEEAYPMEARGSRPGFAFPSKAL